MPFFERVESFRNGESINRFCQRVGINDRQFTDWKRGAIPTVRIVERIAAALETSPCWLLWGAGPKDGPDAQKWEPTVSG